MSTLRQKQEYQAQVAADRKREQQQKDEKAQIWKGGWNTLANISPDDERLYDDIGLPERQREIPREELFATCQQLRSELEGRGYRLNHFGKLEHYLSAQYARGRDLSLDAMRQCFTRLVSLGAFNKGELDVSNVTEQVPETSEVNLDAIDKLPDTREGDREARQIANAHYWSTEANVMFNQWKRHLCKDYNFVPNEEQSRRIIDFFMANNLSFLRHENWNRARRWAVRTRLFPDIRTADERLSETIEATDLSNLSHDEASRLKQSIRTVHGQPFRD